MIRLKELRQRAHLLQKDMADRFGVERTTWVKWETGKHLPGTAMLQEIADHFGVTIDFLLGRDMEGTDAVDSAPARLAPDELHLIMQYRNLSAKDRRTVVSMANTMREQAMGTDADTIERLYNALDAARSELERVRAWKAKE